LSELDDHYEDLLEERSTSMGAARKLQTEQSTLDDLQQRLGEPAQLALFAGEQVSRAIVLGAASSADVPCHRCHFL
jgi:hypothetical protein